MNGLLQELVGIACADLEAFGDQFLLQDIVYVQEVVGVLTSVVQHFRGERSLPPVGQLVLLVSNHIAVVLQQKGKGEALKLKDSTSLPCVEEVHNKNAEILLKPLDIVVRAVKHLPDRWVGKDVSEVGSH